MRVSWTSLGLRFQALGTGLLRTHAMVPTPIVLQDRIKVFFSSCDSEMRGRIYCVDLSLDFPHLVIHFEAAPVLDLGVAGCFDADGVNPCHIMMVNDVLRLYYVGWRRTSKTVPYTLLTGLAISKDGGKNFTRWKEEPILSPRSDERYFRTAPFVRSVDDIFEVLYIGGDRFVVSSSGKLLPQYSIRRTKSVDGLHWPDPGVDVLLPDDALGEIGFGRPRVEALPGQPSVLMFSIRTEQTYRLVECPWDGGPVDRSSLAAVIPDTGEGWASSMTCFGATCQVDNRSLLFYNGDGFGKTGFGLAYKDINI